MTEISKEIFDIINQPGRVGVLSTADGQGQPNSAYFGSLKLLEDGTVILGLGNNRSLKNLEENPLAVLFCVTQSPVAFDTPGYRLYLKVREIRKSGPLLDGVKKAVAELAGDAAAGMIIAGVLFDVTETRPLIAMG